MTIRFSKNHPITQVTRLELKPQHRCPVHVGNLGVHQTLRRREAWRTWTRRGEGSRNVIESFRYLPAACPWWREAQFASDDEGWSVSPSRLSAIAARSLRGFFFSSVSRLLFLATPVFCAAVSSSPFVGFGLSFVCPRLHLLPFPTYVAVCGSPEQQVSNKML